MAALQKFKLLATRCAAADNSPSSSPLLIAASKSPSFHIRRRRTALRRILGRRTRRFLSWRGEDEAAAPDKAASGRAERSDLHGHTSFGDLLASSSPSAQDPGEARGRDGGGEAAGSGRSGRSEAARSCRSPPDSGGGRAAGRRLAGECSSRFRSTAALRYRLLRRPWRPVLLTIPE